MVDSFIVDKKCSIEKNKSLIINSLANLFKKTFENIWWIQKDVVPLPPSVPAKPLNNAQISGPFYFLNMKVHYTKVCTLPQDLIPLLQSRGLSISDEQQAIGYLTNIGYFRLSAYCYPLLKEPKTEHLYKIGASFDSVMNMYRFDRNLRILLFNEIEKIEVAIRSAINNWLSYELNDVFWINNPDNFHDRTNFSKTSTIIQSEMSKTKEEFIYHFQNTYIEPFPPVWMVSEIISFGVLCGIYNNLNSASLKKKVANCFELSFPVFSSWILTISNLRNLCAHHSRIWNRDAPIVPAEPKTPAFP